MILLDVCRTPKSRGAKVAVFCYSFFTARDFANARGAIILTAAKYVILFFAVIPFIYYLLVLYSTIHFFRDAMRRYGQNTGFTPPVCCLKPIITLVFVAFEYYARFLRNAHHSL